MRAGHLIGQTEPIAGKHHDVATCLLGISQRICFKNGCYYLAVSESGVEEIDFKPRDANSLALLGTFTDSSVASGNNPISI